MPPNPYVSPTTDATPPQDATKPPGDTALHALVRDTFRAWERLRILYIALLGILTIAIAGRKLGEMDAIAVVAIGALVANVCFFAGPTVESYVRWLGYEGKWVRWFLFIGGTLLAALLTVVTLLLTLFFPNPH